MAVKKTFFAKSEFYWFKGYKGHFGYIKREFEYLKSN